MSGASGRVRGPDGRFRRGATGDLAWLDKALAPARRRAHALNGPVSDPAPPAPVPEPQPEPAPSGPQIPSGPMGTAPTGDVIRDTLLRRYRR
jgi:hypothetical protein